MSSLASAAPYRQTFLRRHIHDELHPRTQPDGRLREEVLALDNLRYRLGQAFSPRLPDDVIRSAVTLRDFFYGGKRGIGTSSDMRLYLEVPVTRIASAQSGAVPAPAGKEPSAWRELSHLLRDESVAPRGVVLRARSGAGKTTAMLKAFHDCLFSAGETPLLAGRLPCYLRDLSSDSPPIARALRKADAKGLIERMLLCAAGWRGATLRMLKNWLRWSPPLLVFLDLNTAAEEVALYLAQALSSFQRTWAEQGHRCVVAYRSFGQDKVYNALHDRGGFAFYDLQPLPYGLARGYLEHLAAYETWLRERLTEQTGQSAVGAAPQYDLALLERLVRQHVRGADGVLSTPLLVHLFSLLRGERQRQVRCLADLYHEVVEEYLDREYGHLEGRERVFDAPPAVAAQPELSSGNSFGTAEGRVRLKAALVRVALAILGQPASEGGPSTRLLPLGKTPAEKVSAERVLQTLLERPADLRFWWPAEKEWRKGLYFTEKYTPDECLALKRRSLLRLDGSTYGFLHDSFLYWFAALGLRCPRTPEPGLSSLGGGEGREDPWFGLATRRMHANPATWRLPAEFVGGLLAWEELALLTREVLMATPLPGWPDVLLNLARGRRRPEGTDDALLAGVERALLHKLPGVFAKSGEDTALASAVYHYLRDAARLPAERQGWLELLLRRLRESGPRWLHSAEPTFWPLPALRVHRGTVTCVAVLNNDERVVSGGEDGQVVLWYPETGNWQVLYQHVGAVRSVAVSGDGRIVASGGSDNRVRRAVDGVADAEPLLRHDNLVSSVAVSGDGRIVASGGRDKCVRRAVDGVADAETLLRHDDGVSSVAVSGDGRIVASAGGDKYVRRAVDGVADAEYLLRHEGEVSSVAVSGDGRIVASGGEDKCVRRAVDGVAAAEPLLRHDGPVWSVAVSGDGRIVASGGYDKCVRRAVDGVADAEPLLRHDGWVWSVAVSGDGRIVASGGYDKCVRRAVDGVAAAEPLLRHDGWVRSVAVSGDGRIVASGGEDKCVRRAVDGVAAAEPLLRHDGPVWSVAVSGDGRIVASGGEDKCVRRAVDGVADAEPLLRHDGRVRSVAVSGDGRIVASGGSDNFVRRAVDGVADAEPLLRHDDWVRSVAVSGDGRIVASGGEDKCVRRAVDGVADAEPLLRHDDWVRSVAVSGDGRIVASAGGDKYVRRAVDGVADAEYLLRHEGEVSSVAVSGDGRIVASGGEDKCVRRAVDGVADAEYLLRHDGWVRSVAVSGDGRIVASGGEDNFVRRAVDGVADAEPLLRHDGSVYAVAVSGDGRIVASGGDDATIRLWFADGPRPLVYLCNAAVRGLSMTANGRRIVAHLANGEVLTLDLVTPDGASSGSLD